MAHDVLLKMEGISKTFPGVKALDNVNLEVKAGTVHALMGENGAGKSTLMKCLFGMYKKDAGHIYLEGKEIDFKSSKEALDNGVAMVHQHLELITHPKFASCLFDNKKPFTLNSPRFFAFCLCIIKLTEKLTGGI